eukprot:15441249-Alexandrium_andersonii.AAC.1
MQRGGSRFMTSLVWHIRSDSSCIFPRWGTRGAPHGMLVCIGRLNVHVGRSEGWKACGGVWAQLVH